MSNVLIATQLQDMHALSVAHALRLKGHQPFLWYGADFPIAQSGSIHIASQEVREWGVRGPALDVGSDHLDVIWYRRAIPSILPDGMHSEDRQFAESECREFVSALWRFIAPEAFWVNPLVSREYARSKPVQLAEAARAGLNVPPTLFSNDPARIREFIGAHEGDVIYKPFRTTRWKEGEESTALLFTSTVDVDDLPDDDVLRLAPGIFQPRIEKAYELRVTYMGGFQIAVKLMSQENDASALDWRAVFAGKKKNLRIEPVQLPEGISRSCRRLMKRLGIVFGCFDFIVTPQGEHYFLEVNEMGQFLWIEHLNPEIRLLEPFTEFLIHGGGEFEWRPSRGEGIHLLDFFDELAGRHVREEIPLHVMDSPIVLCGR